MKIMIQKKIMEIIMIMTMINLNMITMKSMIINQQKVAMLKLIMRQELKLLILKVQMTNRKVR